MTLSVKQRKEILSLHREGWAAREIAKKFGVSRTTVYNWISRGKDGEFEDRPRIKDRPPRSFPVEVEDKILALYLEGHSCTEIAEVVTPMVYGSRAGKPRFRVSYATVSRKLKERGINVERRGRGEVSQELEKRVCALRREGAGMREIVADTELHENTISRILHRNGLYYMREIDGQLEFYDE